MPGAAPRVDEWSSTLGSGHPLAGRLFDVAAGREIGEDELLRALAGARFALLGEQHENADHHRLQARVIRGLAERGTIAAIAFEMLRADQQAALDALRASEAPSAQALRAATRWDEGGWPDFALYAPVFEAALATGRPLIGADLAARDRKRLAAGPAPPDLRARFGLAEPLPAPVQQALERDLVASHCDMLPESVLWRLVQVQRGRDAQLAQALLGPGSEAPGTVVLLAGAEHVRRDRGAPHTLARLAPGAGVRALAFLEVDDARTDAAADLAARYGGERVFGRGAEPPFDYVWYTPRASDEDYCERMKR